MDKTPSVETGLSSKITNGFDSSLTSVTFKLNFRSNIIVSAPGTFEGYSPSLEGICSSRWLAFGVEAVTLRPNLRAY